MTEWKDSLEFSVNFPQPCIQTSLCTIDGEVTIQERHLALSFSDYFPLLRMHSDVLCLSAGAFSRSDRKIPSLHR